MTSYSSFATSDIEGSMYTEMETAGSDSPCSDWNYYFNSMVSRSNEEIKKESKFLGETCYSTKNFKIVAGISIARGLIPSINVTNTILNLPEEQVTVSFSDIEWTEFMKIATSFMNMDNDEDVSSMITAYSLSENFTVSSVTFFGERMIKLTSREVNLCFCLDDIKSFLRIQDMIDYRLSLLAKLDFRTFYDNLLKYFNVETVNENNCLNVIKEYCDLNICELSYFMLEFVHLSPEKIKRDFNRICNLGSDV